MNVHFSLQVNEFTEKTNVHSFGGGFLICWLKKYCQQGNHFNKLLYFKTPPTATTRQSIVRI